MHARLLAMSYDNTWAERLRKRVLAELLGLAAKCVWIGDLGDPHSMSAPELLVLEALLPEARKSVEHQHKKSERKRKEKEREDMALGEEVSTTITHIRAIAGEQLATPAVCDELREHLDEYFRLVTAMRASGRSDPEWLELKKQALRPQQLASVMREQLDKLSQHRAISAGWLATPTIVVAVVAVFLLPAIIPGILPWLIAGIIAMLVWRLLPDYWMMQSIRKLGEAF
jgi:hypothetical protein